MLLYINRETDEIVSDVYISPRPGEERSMGELAKNLEIVEPPAPPLQAFMVTDETVIAKYLEALETWTILKPVYDASGATLIDLEAVEPDFDFDLTS
jgi:hypothetical protein